MIRLIRWLLALWRSSVDEDEFAGTEITQMKSYRSDIVNRETYPELDHDF